MHTCIGCTHIEYTFICILRLNVTYVYTRYMYSWYTRVKHIFWADVHYCEGLSWPPGL